MYRISQLARQFGLSRSTLLYYDQIGLLSPSERSETGYRHYSSADRNRLDDAAMKKLHVEFERREPEAHHAFLLSLGISEKEALLIRKWSAAMENSMTMNGHENHR